MWLKDIIKINIHENSVEYLQQQAHSGKIRSWDFSPSISPNMFQTS